MQQLEIEAKMATHNDGIPPIDLPEILAFIFYPRRSYLSKPDIRNHSIEVEKGIRIGCRFYSRGLEYPSLLYFHGNGEIVDDYDLSAQFYNEIGINLFVADYRGYGFSDGRPTMSNMLKDSNQIFKEFNRIVEKHGLRKSFFVMGRSLGSIPAIEVACQNQNAIQGLIIESGSANNFRHFFGSSISKYPIWSDESRFLNKVKMRSISKPTLIIHAEYDTIVPIQDGKELFRNASAKDKHLVIIPDADHNDLMLVGRKQYFKVIEEFTKNH